MDFFILDRVWFCRGPGEVCGAVVRAVHPDEIMISYEWPDGDKGALREFAAWLPHSRLHRTEVDAIKEAVANIRAIWLQPLTDRLAVILPSESTGDFWGLVRQKVLALRDYEEPDFFSEAYDAEYRARDNFADWLEKMVEDFGVAHEPRLAVPTPGNLSADGVNW